LETPGQLQWHEEFAKVIQCMKCTTFTDLNLLRDRAENVPQPGYIGQTYSETRLLLVAQNPAVPPVHLSAADRTYTAALRTLQQDSTAQQYRELHAVLQEFIPKWPVHGSYFPLQACGLSLRDIAYINLVRCRTLRNSTPNRSMARNCINEHFSRWLKLLSPKVVVFIGKWANDVAHDLGGPLDIPCAFMNRHRSLSTEKRAANRAQVVELVRTHCGR
jgi:uracil-DNA glycosylase